MMACAVYALQDLGRCAGILGSGRITEIGGCKSQVQEQIIKFVDALQMSVAEHSRMYMNGHELCLLAQSVYKQTDIT